MFYRYDFMNTLTWIFTILLIFGGLIYFGVVNDKIDIEITNNYLDEYAQCQLDLERTQPICPACECKQSSVGFIVYGLIGVIWGFLLNDWFRNRQVKKKAKPSYKTDSGGKDGK